MNDAYLQNLQQITAIEEYDAIVLGAGVSGLVSASILTGQGQSHILVVDEYDHVGGNHIDWSSQGYTFDIGSLIFQDDSPLLTHFPELLSLYVPIEPSWGRLNPQGMITDYPISMRDDIVRAGAAEIIRILASVLYARLFQRGMRNAKEFARYWIGARLLWRSGLESYMKRFYGIAPEQIDIDLARKRMLWISEHASLPNLVRRLSKPKPAAPSNRQLARPKAGFASLYRLATERLEQRGVRFELGVKMNAIEKIQDLFHLKVGDRVLATRRLISTIPIEQAETLCAMERRQPLETITLITLYFSFSGARGFLQSIIYNFSHDGAWKRLTVYSDFYGRANEREYFAAEVLADQVGGSIEKAEADFRDHVRANGLFDGDLKLEGGQILTNAYPIYRRGAAQHAAEAIKRLGTFGIESFGRHGAFNYQPTARVSTIDAETALGFKRETH
ncbi:NAD(P)-binding protein [Rhizobium puerariae]|uniref:NAD(P)-binding protein n=1 Tax=Rhizobium puerariae TaxID=1585791 RepID=A0ABV6ACH9_9HYPH